MRVNRAGDRVKLPAEIIFHGLEARATGPAVDRRGILPVEIICHAPLASSMMTPRYREVHSTDLVEFVEAADFRGVGLSDFAGAERDAAAVTTGFVVKGKHVLLGMGLVRSADGWRIRDLDFLPVADGAKRFIDEFRAANPAGRR